MITLTHKKFISVGGQVIDIHVTYNGAQFHTDIHINHIYISRNTSFAHSMLNDDIFPHIEKAEVIEDINNKLVELSSMISDKLSSKD